MLFEILRSYKDIILQINSSFKVGMNTESAEFIDHLTSSLKEILAGSESQSFEETRSELEALCQFSPPHYLVEMLKYMQESQRVSPLATKFNSQIAWQR